ncbi:hypothetical protein BDV95DRAFT_560336 [Massariosphaeria phaeospora]|uniref:Uncharacterized protein n=1 Tax=Massariosphaeria phaeospora TaxID=100035 RepID=A0A7C8MT13_9PLEO|nr:hypothetical protein BDV95DRAFT_560336 [Massariosphaeria phaeospora]
MPASSKPSSKPAPPSQTPTSKPATPAPPPPAPSSQKPATPSTPVQTPAASSKPAQASQQPAPSAAPSSKPVNSSIPASTPIANPPASSIPASSKPASTPVSSKPASTPPPAPQPNTMTSLPAQSSPAVVVVPVKPPPQSTPAVVVVPVSVPPQNYRRAVADVEPKDDVPHPYILPRGGKKNYNKHGPGILARHEPSAPLPTLTIYKTLPADADLNAAVTPPIPRLSSKPSPAASNSSPNKPSASPKAPSSAPKPSSSSTPAPPQKTESASRGPHWPYPYPAENPTTLVTKPVSATQTDKEEKKPDKTGGDGRRTLTLRQTVVLVAIVDVIATAASTSMLAATGV